MGTVVYVMLKDIEAIDRDVSLHDQKWIDYAKTYTYYFLITLILRMVLFLMQFGLTI
jgi:hypothetical protein